MIKSLAITIIAFFALFIFTVKAEAAPVKVDEPCDLKYSMDLINPNRGHNPAYPGSVDLGVYKVPSYNGTTYTYQMCNSTKVYASISGTVTTDYDAASGNKMRITAADGTIVRYLHLASYVVTSGTVRVGDHVATIGSTGDTDGFVHIHFNVLEGSEVLGYSEWEFADIDYSDSPLPNSRQVAGNFEGDINDPDDDSIIMKDLGNNTMRLWNYVSSGTGFTEKVGITVNDWSVAKSRHIVAGKFNNDHLDDVAIFYDNGLNKIKIFVFITNPDGTLQPPIHWYSSVTGGINWDINMTLHVEAGDFNGDGKTDIAAMQQTHSHKVALWVWLNSGNNGLLYPSQWYASGSTTWESRGIKFMNAGDFNADGKDDLVGMFDDGNDNMYLRMFTSTGSSFGVATVYDSMVHGVLDVSRSLQMVSGDSNNDNKDEITIAYHTPANRLKLNTFTFNGSTMPFVEKYASAINDWKFDTTKYSAMGDFTGDGLEEPVMTSKLQDSRLKLWVFKTDSSGSFVREVWHVTSGTWNI